MDPRFDLFQFPNCWCDYVFCYWYCQVAAMRICVPQRFWAANPPAPLTTRSVWTPTCVAVTQTTQPSMITSPSLPCWSVSWPGRMGPTRQPHRLSTTHVSLISSQPFKPSFQNTSLGIAPFQKLPRFHCSTAAEPSNVFFKQPLTNSPSALRQLFLRLISSVFFRLIFLSYNMITY